MVRARIAAGQIIGKLRDGLLNREAFYALREAQVLPEGRRQAGSTFRPHGALRCKAPAAHAGAPWTASVR